MATLYEVLKLQRERGEVGPCALNLRNQRRYPLLPSQRVVRFWDAGEGHVALDSDDAAVPNGPRVAVGEAE